MTFFAVDAHRLRRAVTHRHVLLSLFVLHVLPFVPLLQNCYAQTEHAGTWAIIGGHEDRPPPGVFYSESFVSASPPLITDIRSTAHAISTGVAFPNTAAHFHLRGLSEIVRINPINIIGGNFVSQAVSDWSDYFTVSGQNLPGLVRFHYSLTGSIRLERLPAQYGGQSGYAGATVHALDNTLLGHYASVVANMPEVGEPFFDSGNINLLLPPGGGGFYQIVGTSFFDVPVQYTSEFTVRGYLDVSLRTDAQSTGAVNSIANFMDTFNFTAITLTDGTPLSEAGLTIQFDSLVSVPEPSALLLLLVALLAFLSRRVRTLLVHS